MKTTLYTLIISSCLTIASTLAANAQPGSLDNTFGSGGIATATIGGSDYANSTAIQSDGKIVVVGYDFLNGYHDFALVRFNSDGTLDNTFGSGGIVTTDFGYGYDAVAAAVAIQSDGKIVVAGNISYGDYAQTTDFALIRYKSDGTLDKTFGSGGVDTSTFDGSVGVSSVAIQNDGKIIVGGVALVRCNSNGTFDNTFGSGGIVSTPFRIYSVVIQSDDKIVTAGFTWNANHNDFDLARYNSDGSLDNTFDTDGIVTTDFGFEAEGLSVAIQSDYKIVVAGLGAWNFNNNAFALARYNIDGSLDTTFDSDGKVITDFGNVGAVGYSVAIQSDGKIVVAGDSYNDLYYYYETFALARYNSDGSLDSTFDSDGLVTTDIGGSNAIGSSTAIQSDGKIVVAGYSNGGFTVARYNGSICSSATIITGGPTSFCKGENVLLTASPSNAVYQWLKNNAAIGGATAQTYTAAKTASFACIVTSGCETDTSSAIGVTKLPKPDASISAKGSTTFCDGDSVILKANSGTGYTYQWHKGTRIISGATKKKYTASSTGKYFVEVTDQNGCTNKSNNIQVSVDCRTFVPGGLQPVTISPNPFSQSTIITFQLQGNERLSLKIYDLQGRLIRMLVNESMSAGNHSLTWDARDENGNDVSDGIYFLKMQSKDFSHTEKLIVTK